MACTLSVRWSNWVFTWLHHALLRPYHATGLSLYPLEILENLWFSDVFRGYRKITGMKWVNAIVKFSFPLAFVEQTSGLQLYLKKTLAQVFSCEFCEIFKNIFFS